MKGPIALVTNVCHFVGLPAARALQEEGFTVICHDASFAEEAARNSFCEENPGLLAMAEQEPTALIVELEKEIGAVDILVSNDAFPALRAPIDEAPLDDFRATLEALTVQPFAFARAVAGAMKARGRGKMIFVTSAAPLRGLANYSMYVTARGAANALALSLARELGPFGIQVNAFAPNFVESPTYFPEKLLSNPEAMAKITSQIPLGRLGKPEEAGAYIAFLASSKADFVTGQVIPFAGGWA